MNAPQVSSTIDRAATVIATWFLTWLVSKKWISDTDMIAFLPILIAVPAAFMGWWKNRTATLVATTDALPGVKGVVTSNSMEGRDLANAVPSPTVVPAGTTAATEMAKPGT